MSENPPTDASEDDVGGTNVWARDTAPQTPYTLRQVGTGIGIMVIVAALAFGIPLLLS